MHRKQIRTRKEYLHSKTKTQDSEYKTSHYLPPQILLTTSRHPSSRLKIFLKELSSLFPNSTTVNRGAYKLKQIHSFSIQKGFTDTIIIHEHKGEPNGLIITHNPVGPTIYFSITNCIMRCDISEERESVSLAYPHLVFEGFNEMVGERVVTILKNLFPIAKVEGKRVLSFFGREDFVSVRHHVFEKKDFKSVELREVGPRFELKPFMIKLGSFVDRNATVEWSAKGFINTAGKNLQVSKL